MARSKTINNRKQINIFFTPVFLLLWLLVKIGQFEFWIIKSLWAFFKLIFKITSFPLVKTFKLLGKIKFETKPARNSYSKIVIKKIEKATKNQQSLEGKNFFQFKFPSFFIKKHRGRPRTQPFLLFYGKKIKKVLDFIFPKPLRIALLLTVVSLIIFGYSFLLVGIAHDLPNPDRLRQSSNALTNEFYDRNGKLLYRLYEDKNRSLIKIDEVPKNLINATIAIEDKNFYSHPGIDLFGITRAFISDIQHNPIQGGSTLTQQLIKTLLLTPDRTLKRKIQEAMLSFWAERIFSKNEILQMYLNEISYGGPTLGVGAAAQVYFGKAVKDLNLAESAFLAGLPASPTTYSPYGQHPELAKKRQEEVLRRMAEDGYISQDEAGEAIGQSIVIKPFQESLYAPHFVMYARSYLEQKYGQRFLTQGGFKITTSLDMDIQQKVQTIVGEEVAKLTNLQVSNGAALVEDPRTGEILAMVGSKNYDDPQDGNFNVTLALRQPGSSIKPITYATGFKFGLTPGTILLDTPTVFPDGVNTYRPVNYDGKFHGPVSLRTALGSSYNIPAVKTLFLVGLPSMIQTAKDLGITTFNEPERYGLSLTLGAGEVRLIDMVTAYSTFSQMGIKHYPQPILKIVDSSGNVIEDNSTGDPGLRVLNAGIAYLITDILKDNKARTPAFGDKSLLTIADHDVAVKTGTTDSKKDNWTLGYTPDLTVGVWVGNNDNRPMDARLTSGVTGAAPIWNRIMTTLLRGKDTLTFIKPLEVKDGSVDGNRDLVLDGQEVKTITKVVAQETPNPSDNPLDKPLEPKNAITYTDPFSSFTFDPTKP